MDWIESLMCFPALIPHILLGKDENNAMQQHLLTH